MTATLIPREKAIDRMRDGLPCETFLIGADRWAETDWPDFKSMGTQFRIPPEPRRDAREWWIAVYRNTGRVAGCAVSAPTDDDRTVGQHLEYIHVREVLDDEVTLAKMTEECWSLWFAHQVQKDSVFARRTSFENTLDIARALGLIRGDKA